MRLPIAGWTVASCGPDSPQPENEEIHKGQAHFTRCIGKFSTRHWHIIPGRLPRSHAV